MLAYSGPKLLWERGGCNTPKKKSRKGAQLAQSGHSNAGIAERFLNDKEFSEILR
jgi:hypothetical protein